MLPQLVYDTVKFSLTPEYGIGNEVSTYGDIYSYGVLLLEMVTGKRPTDSMFDGGLDLHNYAKMTLPDRVMQIVDPSLHSAIASDEATTSSHNPRHSRNGGKTEECLKSLVEIGVACSMEAPQDRMDMSEVVTELHLLRDILLPVRVPRQTA
ncbi:hypothetical protein F0562_035089 [Nyssa sinensis]|uniref:Protein kinase domain-containing protein n=1 Tax=Nyssa sinensis TaxID=561372 RepID=A0A5J5ADU0_9ASTE|nr:hypothetical protein F0562_035089 [Nyssa sinensis]